MKQDGFAGMLCTWYANTASNPERLFYCVTTNRSSLMTMQDKVVESSIQVQHTLFHQLDEQEVVLTHNVQHILITMYKSNKFFPVEKDRLGKEDVTSPVVGVKLGKCLLLLFNEVTELKIYIMFKTIWLLLKLDVLY